ncbi:hypothetical protein [Rhizobium sp. 2MFCol3.1]|uniref:hypothetical protein n=1 Tax=Rhizobium sp. 2MFCol3.1 TaxID=1246459 RepID=UPI0012DBDFB9|nr:hypothetical protein [Rhizobium sp. 2MFCol3.1]
MTNLAPHKRLVLGLTANPLFQTEFNNHTISWFGIDAGSDTVFVIPFLDTFRPTFATKTIGAVIGSGILYVDHIDNIEEAALGELAMFPIQGVAAFEPAVVEVFQDYLSSEGGQA